MRKKFARTVAFGLLITMAATTLLSGCGSSDKGGDKGDSGSDEQVTLTLPVWDSETTPYIADIIEGFEAENPNIKINMVDVAASEYMNKLSVMLNGGADCDIVYIKDADSTPSFADKGQLEDLTSYIEKDGIDTSKYVSYDDFNLDGKQVALPFKTDYYVLYYNKDIFDAAGVAYPTNDMTWTEWEEMCSKLTSGEGSSKIYGGYLHTWQACVENWAIQDGENTILGPDYSFMKPYYEMALRMQDAGTIMDFSTLKTGNIAYASPFQQGTVATLPMGTWFSATMIAKKDAGETDVSEHKEEAWEFIKYACGEEGAKAMIATGQMPAYQDDTTLDSIAALEGMPEGAAEALATKNIVLDRPIDSHSAEINQMLGEEHSLIMIKEKSIDDVLQEMSDRSKEIQGE